MLRIHARSPDLMKMNIYNIGFVLPHETVRYLEAAQLRIEIDMPCATVGERHGVSCQAPQKPKCQAANYLPHLVYQQLLPHRYHHHQRATAAATTATTTTTTTPPVAAAAAEAAAAASSCSTDNTGSTGITVKSSGSGALLTAQNCLHCTKEATSLQRCCVGMFSEGTSAHQIDSETACTDSVLHEKRVGQKVLRQTVNFVGSDRPNR